VSPLRRRLAWLLASIGTIAALACGDPSHVYAGRRFAPERGCVEPSTSLDVVTGTMPSQPCAPACLAQPHPDGGRSIFVSTMCAPFPYGFDPSGTDPLCPSALAASARNDTCFDDGGSKSPLPPVDAGADAMR
jgi:hypothetical protein